MIVRYLELESSGRRNEIRFIYTAMDARNNPTTHTESFSYTLADSKWHKVSLTVSGPEIQLLVDCQLIDRRMADHIPDRNFSASEMHLFVGQRDNQYQLKVSILNAILHFGSNFEHSGNIIHSLILPCYAAYRYHFQGIIEDAYIVSGPNGYLKQCPNIETQCPTCGQYSNLLKTLDDLLKKVDDLTQRVSTVKQSLIECLS